VAEDTTCFDRFAMCFCMTEISKHNGCFVTFAPEVPARVGVSVVGVNNRGMNT